MQVALHDAREEAAVKAAVSNSTLQTMLAEARTNGVIGLTAMETQRQALNQAHKDRGIINDLNTQNLNTALINTETAIIGSGIQYGGLGLAYGGAVGAVQTVNAIAATNALGSAISGQRFVNTGNVANVAQTSNPQNLVSSVPNT